jgi:membrane protease YdiL (CAAX protease family)
MGSPHQAASSDIMTTNEQTRVSGRGARWLTAAELAAAGAVLALVPREAEGTPGVWLLGALLVLSSLGLWLRGASFRDVGLGGAASPRTGSHALLGLALGALAALAASFVVGPGLAAITSRSLDAGVPAAVQGSAMALVLGLLVAWAHALGAEMIFRGWLLDRAETLWPASPVPGDGAAAGGDASGREHASSGSAVGPLVLAGLAFGWYLGDGSAGALISGALLGVGLCLLRRAGQSLTLPIAAHGAYASTHLALAYMNVLT